MKPAITLWSIVGLVLIGLAVPPALKQKSWRTFLIALVLSFFGVLLPLFIFLASVFLAPDSKADCRFGWLDCFYVGKLALTPLVLGATAALYALDIYGVANRTRYWIVLGIFLGAIVAFVCFLFGVVVTAGRVFGLWLLVPCYVAVWYSIRAVQLAKVAKFGPFPYLWAFGSSIPLWLGSWLWSRSIYSSLPEQSPQCFVVTAAARGHESLVGPFMLVQRQGYNRRVNRQLATFWALEAWWQAHGPRSHARFRRCYNRFGPILAGWITSPWRADLVHLAIKPVELAARLVIRHTPAGGKGSGNRQTTAP